MAELLPCPFCGAAAEMYITKHIPSGNDYTPRCTNTSCCGRLLKKYTVRETAVAMWNRRTPKERGGEENKNALQR